MRLVLRSRQQVETALLDFHNELNHLNVNKCLRLLNERFLHVYFPYMSEITCSYHAIIVHSLMFDRYYWQTMKPDVVQWINNCSRCSLKMKKKPCHRAEADRSEMQSLTSAQHASPRWSGSSYYIIVEGRNITLPTLTGTSDKPRKLHFYYIIHVQGVLQENRVKHKIQ